MHKWIHALSEGFSTGAVMRKVGFSGSSLWKKDLSCRRFVQSTLYYFIFALKKVRVLWPKRRQDTSVFHTLEPENPTFLMDTCNLYVYGLLTEVAPSQCWCGPNWHVHCCWCNDAATQGERWSWYLHLCDSDEDQTDFHGPEPGTYTAIWRDCIWVTTESVWIYNNTK